jgi:hypothetical protein
MQNQVFSGLALIAAAIVIYGVIGLFGTRYVSHNVPDKTSEVWVSDRLTGAVYKCTRSIAGKAMCGE